MRILRLRTALLVVGCSVAAVPVVGASSADAHRSGCHGAHQCPSDRATYSWHGKYCLSPRNGGSPSYGRRVVYQGLTYYCR